eukprot:CAMPEP_0185733576 /NCGR_PEP_ID=MMETSP1171-20130828/20001_1 /TAXON_ID=374046 /ORGANISM="Helicotheca tamensis, Strain CCMP826" /LENGTH=137 /DNA_ID=CAMNT_0028403343 /DNA_START=158 /DNA_END=568 /DNA_ORIENTATION=+
MTHLSVVAPLTSVVGKIELGQQNLTELTVGDLKDLVEELHGSIPADRQKLWWMGYILDDDSLPIEKACIGVNPGEVIEKNAESLTIFMTMTPEDQGEEKEVANEEELSSLPMRIRTNSYDIEQIRIKIRQQKENINW